MAHPDVDWPGAATDGPLWKHPADGGAVRVTTTATQE